MQINSYKWLTFGPGAISGLIAAGLIRQQQQVAFNTRAAGSTAVQWVLHDSGGQQQFETPTYQHQWQPDAVILAVKSYQLNAALKQLDELSIATDCPVIISHNGIVSLTTERPLFPLITTHAASRNGREIFHNGEGESWLANTATNQPKTLPAAIASIIGDSFAPLALVTDIDQRRWQKLLINCVINPLTAIYRITNGELAEQQYAKQREALIGEFIMVASACGHVFEVADAQQSVERVIAATASNRSSMLADTENNRPTEIDAMNGFILRQAQRHNITVPMHRWVVKQLA